MVPYHRAFDVSSRRSIPVILRAPVNFRGPVQLLHQQSSSHFVGESELGEGDYLVGGLFYFNYPGGTGLVSGAVFGKLAGASAGRAAA